MTRRTKSAFSTPVARRWGKRPPTSDTPPPPHEAPEPLPRQSRVGVFSIDATGRVTPIVKAQPMKRHWARVPGVSAVDGKIYPSWEEAHKATGEE